MTSLPRQFASLAFLLFFALAAGAQTAGSTAGDMDDGRTLKAGIFCDLFTLLGLSNRPAVSPGYAFTGEDVSDFTRRPAFLSAGFFIRRGWLEVFMSIDLHQDIGAWLLGGTWSNLPKAPDSWSVMWGNNYPQVGYAQASGPGWLVSAGRRKIGMGPGTYGLAASDGNPWYDHALASVEAPAGSGSVGYSLTTLGTQRWWGLPKKNLFIHRVWWRTKRLSIALGELNLVVGDSVDLQDIGPFLIYHHLFASNSNVMLELEAQARPVDPIRLYGEFVLDDFQIPGEGSGSNPIAMGFMAGLEWTILPDVRKHVVQGQRPSFLRTDHGLKLDARPLSDLAIRFDKPGELTLKAESYFASTYLYRRSSGSPYETWTNRYFFQSSSSLYSQTIEPFYASPLGPDTWLNRLELSWNRNRIETSLAAEYRVLGAESERKDYSYPYAESWLGPQEPVKKRLDLVIRALFAPDNRFILTGAATLSFRETETRMSVEVGVGYRFGTGPLRNIR